MSTITIQHGNFKLSEIQTLDIQQQHRKGKIGLLLVPMVVVNHHLLEYFPMSSLTAV